MITVAVVDDPQKRKMGGGNAGLNKSPREGAGASQRIYNLDKRLMMLDHKMDARQTDQEIDQFEQYASVTKDAGHQVYTHDTIQQPVDGTDYDQDEGH